MLEASNRGIPVINYEQSEAGQAYDDVVARFLNEERPYRFIDVKKKGWLGRIFGDQ